MVKVMVKTMDDLDQFSKKSSGSKPIEPELVSNSARNLRIEQLRKIAEFMDGQFRIPGTNVEFGADAIIGLIPGVGDVICGVMSLWLIQEAKRLGTPRWLLARMFWNVAIEVGIGAVPIAGDLFDVAWKANRKNINLLRRHFAEPS